MTNDGPYPSVAGGCPACGHSSLFLGEGGEVTCARLECPHPDAVSVILHEARTDHVVSVTGSGVDVLHPLGERIDFEILRCPVLDLALELSIDMPEGHYAARQTPFGGLTMTPLR